jgi:hypothetical protein
MMAKQTFSTSQISETEVWLRSLPKVEKRPKDLNKSEAIRVMANAIRAAQKNGHSLADIAAGLSVRGITISASTLKNYLQRSGRGARRPQPEPASTTPLYSGDPNSVG